MSEESLEGRTTDPATWLRTPVSFAAFTRAANARRRAVKGRQDPAADSGSPVDRHRPELEQQHRPPGQGRGPGLHL
ncbi:hypothetical protein YW3DRAFT_07359 [Streptomyces sp. MnatMP-M77]|nr:hypothetical protein YW3DRAFT_07359 [Streptomyces sp. MnatMP-M77]